MHYVKKYFKFFKGPASGFFSHWIESKSNCTKSKVSYLLLVKKTLPDELKTLFVFCVRFFRI